MSGGRWLLYGAYGFTGRLIAAEAVERGLAPVLAGRREAPLRALAREHGLEWRAFPLDDPVALAREIGDVDAVLLAAGPFAGTSGPVVDACLTEGVHYADITGEIPVFEAVFARHDEAVRRGVTLLPGVGLDVVPSDCLAAALAEALPSADRLVLAIAAASRPSPGTARTMVEGFGRGGRVRVDGALVPVPHAWRKVEVPFPDRPRWAVTWPWGDLATAPRSTGIPNVVVLMAMPPVRAGLVHALGPLAPLARPGPVRRALQRLVDRAVEGPDEERRRTGRSLVWGRVTDPAGRRVEGWAETPEAYRFTAIAAVESVERLAAGKAEAGALTPSMAFGARFVEGLPACDLRIAGHETSHANANETARRRT